MQVLLKRRQTQSLRNITCPTDAFFVSALKTVPLEVIAIFFFLNQTYFYQKCGSCTQKSNETWNLKIRVKIKKKHLWSKGSRWKVVGPKSLYIQDLRIYGSSIGQIRFDLAQIFTKKRSKSAKSNPIFHLKGRRDTSWLYNFWIAQWVNFFLQNYFVFKI